jgi:hypothetical protein
MFDRVTMIVAAGAIAAGLSTALLTGAGVALADTDPGGGQKASTSDSAHTTSQKPRGRADRTTTRARKTKSDTSRKSAGRLVTPDPPASRPRLIRLTPVTSAAAPDVDTPAEPKLFRTRAETRQAGSAAPDEPSPAVTRLSVVAADRTASAEAASPRKQTLLSLIGTAVFDLYGVAIKVFGGPPRLPADSTVTVHTSSLLIDCGDGYEVPVDWYVPEGPTPTRLIYLQHGFLAAAPWYSHTAARLSEATDSIVVATSLTSNFLACNGCWLGGTSMHEAIADLFSDDNPALADSAAAAGYSATLLDGVDKVVLVGHSAGGGLVADTAGYMVDNGTIGRLAGVVMLDGVGFGSVLPGALAKLPDDVPIYDLAGKSYFWNLDGQSTTALEHARPGQFIGVRLVGGLHSDSMVGGNPFIQTALYLVTGFSKPANVDAAAMIDAGWIDDMFAGTKSSPYYGAAGALLEIPTPNGTATAYVSPGPAERLRLIDVVFTYFANIIFGIDFATCVAPRSGPPAETGGFSAPNTALSLDGRAKAGQSIGQQCMQG